MQISIIAFIKKATLYPSLPSNWNWTECSAVDMYNYFSEKIMEVQVIGNSGFVWSLESALKLRKNHRIMGCFVGFTPKTFEVDLPLVLLPEEMQLLKEKNLIKMITLKDTEAPNEKLIKRLIFLFLSK